MQCSVLYSIGMWGVHLLIGLKQEIKIKKTAIEFVLACSFSYKYQLINIMGIFPITAKIKVVHGPI